MDTNSPVYNELNKTWKNTCRVLFGEEIGELKEYEEWLSSCMDPLDVRKSKISGKDVYLAVPDYCASARFVSLEEIGMVKKPEPLNINEIKDIDSIVEALQERFCYSGNIVLANSKNVERSSNIFNSSNVLNSNFIYDSEYIAYSSNVRYCKYLFGANNIIDSSFVIRGPEGFRDTRCFEIWGCYTNSDCYFSFGVEGSQNVLFSFNIKNKRNVIGNLELPKEKFLSLKEKILGELKGELVRRKSLPSLMDLVSGSKKKPEIKLDVEEISDEQNKEPMEAAFRSTTRVVLGRELYNLDAYEKWLMRHVPPVEELGSAVSGKKVYYGYSGMRWTLPRDRIVKDAESRKLGEILKLEKDNIESFDKLKDSLWKIAFFRTEARIGENRNLIGVPLANQSLNCYKGGIYSFNENCAFCYWPRNSRYMFGSAVSFSSNFCINAYYSLNLSRAFEVDCSSNCSDIYFSHNCENVHESMFCFNTKNQRYSIGNVPLALEKYKGIKVAILEQIADELEKNKELRWDVYNIGCTKP